MMFQFSVRALPGLLLVLAGLFSCCPAWAETWRGVVTYVVDGDTLHIRPLERERGKDGKWGAGSMPASRSVRISGIDAPEICQAGGAESRRALTTLLLKRQVLVRTQRHDQFGRDLATLELESQDVGAWMVRHGQAWSYQYRGDRGPYAVVQDQARRARLGLFADEAAEPPRSFRKRHGSCFQDAGPARR